jgi:hypothetical protein
MDLKKIADKIKNYSPIVLLGLCLIYSTFILYWLREMVNEDRLKRQGASLPDDILEQLIVYIGIYSFLIYPIVVLFCLFVIIRKLKNIEKSIDSVNNNS